MIIFIIIIIITAYFLILFKKFVMLIKIRPQFVKLYNLNKHFFPQSQVDLTQAVHQHELSESSNNRSKLAQCTNQSSGNCVTQESRDSNRSLSSSINWSQSDATDSQKVKIAELVNEFADIFVEPDKRLGYCDLVPHEISVDSFEAPKRYKNFRLHPKQQTTMEEITQDFLNQGVIQESNSVWSAPAFLVPKKGKQGWRLITDLRGLDCVTKPVAQLIPSVEQCIDSINMVNLIYF